MKAKNKKNRKVIFGMIAVLACLLVLGCNNDKSQNNAAPPKDTTAAVPAPASTGPDLSTIFYGTWEREENGQYTSETFSKASKKDDKYVGTVSNTNLVLADYTLHDNTIEIKYNPSYYSGATFKFEYTVSNGGEMITLNSKPPIVYKKGASNTSLQDEANIFASKTWASAKDPNIGWDFLDVSKSDLGWSGTYKKWNSGAVTENGEFTISRAGSITIKPSGVAPKTYEYKLKNNNTMLELSRDGISEVWNR